MLLPRQGRGTTIQNNFSLPLREQQPLPLVSAYSLVVDLVDGETRAGVVEVEIEIHAVSIGFLRHQLSPEPRVIIIVPSAVTCEMRSNIGPGCSLRGRAPLSARRIIISARWTHQWVLSHPSGRGIHCGCRIAS